MREFYSETAGTYYGFKENVLLFIPANVNGTKSQTEWCEVEYLFAAHKEHNEKVNAEIEKEFGIKITKSETGWNDFKLEV